MTTLEVLMEARAEVERGWCQGIGEDHRGAVCAMGAVARVIGCFEYDEATTHYWSLLTKVAPCSVRKFNDDPTTTKADVLDLFDRAINAEAVAVSPDPAHTFTTAA